MPFRSEAQRRLMFATMPTRAKKWAEETPKNDKLPEYTKKSDARTNALRKRLGGK